MRIRVTLLILSACSAIVLSPAIGRAQTGAADSPEARGSTSAVVSESYPDGRPRLWQQVKEGKADGLWLEWYPSGNLRYRAYWRDDKGDGRWEYFYPSGRLRSDATYSSDVPIGLALEYHENGVLASERTYVDGRLHGLVIEYDPSGIRTHTSTYEYGTRVIDTPELFVPGVIATDDNNEWGITFTPSGDTAYFTRRAANTTAQRIYRTSLVEGEWTPPEIAEFSTGVDEAPFVSADGSEFYFASTRPLQEGGEQEFFDMNLWVMDRVGLEWSPPRPLPARINGTVTDSSQWPEQYESGPVTDSAGTLYYWSGNTAGSSADIFVASREPDGAFAAPLALPMPPNHEGLDSSPVLSPDGRYLIFAAYGREDGFGGEDLYASRREGAGWSTPVNLGPDVNGVGEESFPRFSPDGTYFFFSSNRAQLRALGEEAPSSIYYLESRFLVLPR